MAGLNPLNPNPANPMNPLNPQGALPNINPFPLRGQGAEMGKFNPAPCPVLIVDCSWSRWIPKFIESVEEHGWKNMLIDDGDVEKWPLARSLLKRCTRESDHPMLSECTNLMEALAELKDLHHMADQTEEHILLMELEQMKLKPGETMTDLLARIVLIIANLRRNGTILPDGFKLSKCISVLSQNPAHAVTLDILTTSSGGNLTMKGLMSAFNAKRAQHSVIPGAMHAAGGRYNTQNSIQHSLDKLNEGMALMAEKIHKFEARGGSNTTNRGARGGRVNRGGRTGNDTRKQPYTKTLFDGECNNCGIKGHKAWKCYKPCKICKSTEHNCTKCPVKPKGGYTENRGGNGRPGFHRPKANMAEGNGDGVHGDEEDELPGGSAYMAHGQDDGYQGPPGYEGRSPSGETLYGEAMNVAKYKHVKQLWILDGGATHHFVVDKTQMFDYVPDKKQMLVKTAVDSWAIRAGTGTIRAHTMVNGKLFYREFRNVWHMPTFANSLFSVNQLKETDDWVITGRMGDKTDYIFDTADRMWLTCAFNRGLNSPVWSLESNTGGKSARVYDPPEDTFIPYTSIPDPELFRSMQEQLRDPNVELRTSMSGMAKYWPRPPRHPEHISARPTIPRPSANTAGPSLPPRVPNKPKTSINVPKMAIASYAQSNHPMDKETADLWHQRLGHVSMTALQQLVRDNKIAGIKIPVQEFRLSLAHPCEVCIMSKHNRAPHLKVLPKPVDPDTTASTDICGPYKIKTMNLVAYILTFVCWCTQYVVVELLRKKSDAFGALKRIIMVHENLTKRKLKYLFSDRGGEYTSLNLKDWFSEKGITHDFTCTDDKQQNGVAERVNQSLNNMVRAMMLQYKSYKPLWGEAMMYAVKIKNSTLNKKLGMTPNEAFTGEVPDVGSTWYISRT